MKKASIVLLLSILLSLLVPLSVSAQSYYFSVDSARIDAYYNDDGSMSLSYVYVFTNQPEGLPIDYVDIGLPNSNFNLSDVSAEIDGRPLTDIQEADPSYLNGTDSGVTIGLGDFAIQPGKTGIFKLQVNRINQVMFTYNNQTSKNYASVRFMPNYFGSDYLKGTTDLQVTFHLPIGVQPEEPRWETVQSGWPGNSEPITGYDEQGRIIYTWSSQAASSSNRYEFAAAFPASYIPPEQVYNPTIASFDPAMLVCICIVGIFLAIIGYSFYYAIWGAKKRKMQYLPPKISIEGHGIKRGLTAVEAAILMELPMDKVLTMVLFGVIKKDAAEVKTREPLEITVNSPLPDGLQPYELEFLGAFKYPDARERQKAMQKVVVGLVKSVTEKMKGFSRKETIAYYDGINKRAWAQVEAEGTPEIKSQKFDENLEWTMLDKDYDGRMKETFSQGPVILPRWWGGFDPAYRGTTIPRAPLSTSTTGGGSSKPISVSMPSLPGAAFASSMVSGIQNFASGVVGDITSFTSGITNKTNPPPPPSQSSSHSSGGGGRSCACACACAGCACACAGGGR